MGLVILVKLICAERELIIRPLLFTGGCHYCPSVFLPCSQLKSIPHELMRGT